MSVCSTSLHARTNEEGFNTRPICNNMYTLHALFLRHFCSTFRKHSLNSNNIPQRMVKYDRHCARADRFDMNTSFKSSRRKEEERESADRRICKSDESTQELVLDLASNLFLSASCKKMLPQMNGYNPSHHCFYPTIKSSLQTHTYIIGRTHNLISSQHNKMTSYQSGGRAYRGEYIYINITQDMFAQDASAKCRQI